jgi:manganese oxidase
MNSQTTRWAWLLAAVLATLVPAQVQAVIDGISGATTFNFVVKAGYISTADGNSVLFWGYADAGGGTRPPIATPVPQYPGPTIIVNQGDVVTINLKNNLVVKAPGVAPNVSMLLPGQTGVTVTGGLPGVLTSEAPPDNTTVVTYSFTATNPGTFTYYSGTKPELEIDMGLVGAIIVRPTLGAGYAYNHAATAFDQEYLFLFTEMDPVIHELVDGGQLALVNESAYLPEYWFINGRTAPDTMLDPGVPWLPSQPYNCMPLTHPAEKVLMRVIGGGHEYHPFHFHGENASIVALDGRLLESAPGLGPDLAISVFTIQSAPGESVDAIWQWTGKDLGWDIYGHQPGDPLQPNEWAPDHGKPFPTVMPNPLSLTYGAMYGGSPFLGMMGATPPGTGGLNPMGAFAFMMHSHAEKELTNYNVFPGGLMTMMMVLPPGAPIM